MSFNLPPGCDVSDIPGNRPEDVLYERFLETLEDPAIYPDSTLERMFLDWLDNE